MIKEIENREDLKLLVSTFYEKIRADQEIGFFFNETITNWEEHLEKLTDFWEMNIFGTRKFTGNPIVAHNAVDKKFNQQITSNTFGIWLNIWFATIDELFVGENADVLKRRAQKMSTFLFMNIFESRRKV
ncbi:group III truncated hemoglobin [Flavobacterium sp. P4023]|uniref:Group III truncated hemoglobin n=1 Tax=Flavobacterium flabelliforme TaxID=2816119 RepID=A0ABS5CQC0_9FLAO|nr:group III truncated hemoglobin [Flavobacterium flabelliforme]MBP4140820.1 group III truncated hemoglobin [Flavobacterium flabelliforme]